MFEFGWNQAAGLRAATPQPSASVMPVACTARPGQAYELLCTLAAQLAALGHDAVIVDASASEINDRRVGDGSHLGLSHVLQDPSIAGLGSPGHSAEWLVMPGAQGLQLLLQTARAAGAGVALSRLLAPFSSNAFVLLYAPASTLGALFAGVQAQVMVPVLAQPQATIDAYGSLKLLHAAGLTPVLAPLVSDAISPNAPLAQVVRSVSDCANRYLDYSVEQWPETSWGLQVQASALTASWSSGAQAQPQPHLSADFYGHASASPNHWN